MIQIQLSLPDEVAREYYITSEKLADHLAPLGVKTPDARALMVMSLASLDAEEMVRQFDLALRALTGKAPTPDDEWELPLDRS